MAQTISLAAHSVDINAIFIVYLIHRMYTYVFRYSNYEHKPENSPQSLDQDSFCVKIYVT